MNIKSSRLWIFLQVFRLWKLFGEPIIPDFSYFCSDDSLAFVPFGMGDLTCNALREAPRKRGAIENGSYHLIQKDQSRPCSELSNLNLSHIIARSCGCCSTAHSFGQPRGVAVSAEAAAKTASVGIPRDE